LHQASDDPAKNFGGIWMEATLVLSRSRIARAGHATLLFKVGGNAAVGTPGAGFFSASNVKGAEV